MPLAPFVAARHTGGVSQQQPHASHALAAQTAPRIAGIPLLVNVPAALIVLAITWLLYIGVKETARANNIIGPHFTESVGP